MTSSSSPQFNPRPIFLVLGILLAFGVTVHLIHGWQIERHADSWRAKAEQASRDGDQDQELLALKRYLRFSPGDSTALLRYAQLLQATSDVEKDLWTVADIYQRIVEEDPLRRDLRRDLGKLLVELRAFHGARRHLDALLREEPDDPELLEYLGRCQAGVREIEEAVATFQKCIELDPTREKAFVRLAWLLRHSLKQKTRADEAIEQLVKAHPKSASAWKSRGEYWIAWGDANLATESFAKAGELAPDDIDILKERANLAEKLGRFDEALRLWQEAVAKHPEVAYFHRRLGAYLLDHRQSKEAVDVLERGSEEFPDNVELSYLLIGAYLDLGEIDRAEKIIDSLPARQLPTGMLEYLQARVEMNERNWSKAAKQLESILELKQLSAKVASESALALGECYGQLHDDDKQLQAYRKAVDRRPASGTARIAYAEALLRHGKVAQAFEECLILAKRTLPPPNFWPLYSRVLIRHTLTLPANTRNWKEVEAVLEKASKYSPQKAGIAIVRAEYLLSQNRPDEAQALLDKVQKAEPDNPDLWAAQIRLARFRGDKARVAELQQRAREREQAVLETQQTELEQAVARGDLEKLDAIRERLEAQLPQLALEKQIPLLANLATAYHRLGRLAQGNQIVRQIRQLAGDDLSMVTVALELAVQGQDDYQVEQIVSQLRKLEGESGTWWRYAEAKRLLLRPLLIDEAKLERALELIDEALDRRPEWTRALVFEAGLLDQLNEPDQALDAYYRAFENGDRSLANLRRLVELLLLYGRDHRADRVLRQFPRESLPPSIARMGAELALRLGDHPRAIRLAKQAVSPKSDNFSLLLWLGNILSQAGEAEGAKEVFERAVALEKRTPDTWVALLAQLRRTDSFAEADKTLDAMTKAVLPQLRTLALALANEVLGRNAKAMKEYERARAEHPEDLLVLFRSAEFFVRLDLQEKAQEVLEDLLSRQAQLPESYLSWTRRELALLLAFADSRANYERALELLQTNLAAAGKNPLDERARLLVKATRPSKRSQALRDLEKQSPDRTFSKTELYRLALLYDRADQWSKAASHFTRLLTLDPVNPTYLTSFLDGLVRHGKRSEARSWLPKLEALDPTNPELDRIRGKLSG